MSRRAGSALATVGALATTAVLAGSSLAGPNRSGAFVDCGATQLTFLFWPTGHPAIASVKFPVYAVPHTEVYKTDPTYAGTSFLAFFNSGGQMSIIPACAAAATTTPPSSTIPSPATISNTSAINCTFTQSPQLEIAQQPDGSGLLRVAVPVQQTVKVKVKVKKKTKIKTVTKTVNTTVLTDSMGPASSSLTYDTKLCVAGPPPS